MSTKITKIGIIQTAALPGDFPNNLRAIVNGYRECLEHGAQIVVAPASCVCGAEPGHLVQRRSFLEQTRDCLEALSRELGSAPLILAAYTYIISDDELYVGMVGEDDDYEPWMGDDRSVILTPYLLEKDSVTELEAHSGVTIGEQVFYTDTGDEEILPGEPYDFIVRMPITPWHTTAARDSQSQREWEATMANSTVICCRPVGTAGENVYGGGSTVHTPGGQLALRLPFFEPSAQVVNLEHPKPVLALPEPAELLCCALERGIRDTVRNNCFSGVCIPLDHANSALLGVLCVEALGASNVIGISFTGNEELAQKLGIGTYTPDLEKLEGAAIDLMGNEEAASLRERLRTTIAMTYAESRGMLLCSPLGRREIMLGEFRSYGLSGGHLAPLGSLYAIDMFLCAEQLNEKYAHIFGSLVPPANGLTDRIIHELTERNAAASELLDPDRNYLFKENDVHLVQRRILASALRRTQLPTVLNTAPPSARHHFPVAHRLND